MLWRRSAPLVAPHTAPVPDADLVRLSALRASWSRGRWVAQRRVAWRWLLWVLQRYVMPALAISAVVAWLWLGPMKATGEPMQQLARWMAQPVENEKPQASAPLTPPQSPASDGANAQAMAPELYSPEGEWLDPPLVLKLEFFWAGAALVAPTVITDSPDSPEPDPQPHLKPENWLHSKEP